MCVRACVRVCVCVGSQLQFASFESRILLEFLVACFNCFLACNELVALFYEFLRAIPPPIFLVEGDKTWALREYRVQLL